MKPLAFVRKTPALAVAIAIAASATSVGAFALVNNWFGGSVDSHQEGTIFTVKTEGCAAHFGGVEANQQTVQFKIVKDKGLTPDVLTQRVLQMCEFYAANDFLQTQSPFGQYLASNDPNYYTHSSDSYWLYRAKVKAIKDSSLTVSLFDQGTLKDVTLPFNLDTLVYNKGKTGTINDITVGSSLLIVTKTPGSPQSHYDVYDGAHDVFLSKDTRIVGMFKTQYDMLDGVEHEKSFYDDNGIMPLSTYEQIQHEPYKSQYELLRRTENEKK